MLTKENINELTKYYKEKYISLGLSSELRFQVGFSPRGIKFGGEVIKDSEDYSVAKYKLDRVLTGLTYINSIMKFKPLQDEYWTAILNIDFDGYAMTSINTDNYPTAPLKFIIMRGNTIKAKLTYSKTIKSEKELDVSSFIINLVTIDFEKSARVVKDLGNGFYELEVEIIEKSHIEPPLSYDGVDYYVSNVMTELYNSLVNSSNYLNNKLENLS